MLKLKHINHTGAAAPERDKLMHASKNYAQPASKAAIKKRIKTLAAKAAKAAARKDPRK